MEIYENRMFAQMRKAALGRLLKHDCEEMAKKAYVVYDKKEKIFFIESLGKRVQISFPEFVFNPDIKEWHQLVILHYLDLADGSELENSLISFSQMKDGLIRGGGFDTRFKKAIQILLQRISEEEFKERCFALDGRMISTNADFAVEIPFLPRFPVTLKIWFADEDFEASGCMMLDASADHYLTIEDAVTVGELLLEGLQN